MTRPKKVSSYKTDAGELISRCLDPMTLEIPEDPVLVYYKAPARLNDPNDPPLTAVHVLSLEDGLEALHRQHEDCRATIQAIKDDPSGIKLWVDKLPNAEFMEDDKDCAQAFHTVLKFLSNAALDADRISAICFDLDQLNTSLKKADVFSFQVMVDSFRKMCPIYISEECLNVFVSQRWKYSIASVCNILLKNQASQYNVAHESLRDTKKNFYTTDEVRCPLTRHTIIVSKTRASRTLAKDFVAIAILLAKKAGVEDEKLEEFLKNKKNEQIKFAAITLAEQAGATLALLNALRAQPRDESKKIAAIVLALKARATEAELIDLLEEDEEEVVTQAKAFGVTDTELHEFLNPQQSDYLQAATKTLTEYALDPQGSPAFSKEQQRMLDKMGMQVVVGSLQGLKDSFDELWDPVADYRDNVLALLVDYSKAEDWCPWLSLLLSGHWNRHYLDLVNKAIIQLKADMDVDIVLKDLETDARQKAKIDERTFNEEGCLAKRLRFFKSNAMLEDFADLSLEEGSPAPSA